MKDIWRVGDPQKPEVAFGTLFDDDDVQQHYEGLAATLKAAKKRKCLLHMSCVEFFFVFWACTIFLTHHNVLFKKIIGGIVTYKSPILLKGAHDKVMVNLVDTSPLDTKTGDLEELKSSGLEANAKIECS